MLIEDSGRVLRSVQTLDVDEASQGYTVHSVTFNSNGSAMFVWARCGSRDDLLFTWSIDPFDPKPAAIYELPTVSTTYQILGHANSIGSLSKCSKRHAVDIAVRE